MIEYTGKFVHQIFVSNALYLQQYLMYITCNAHVYSIYLYIEQHHGGRYRAAISNLSTQTDTVTGVDFSYLYH